MVTMPGRSDGHQRRMAGKNAHVAFGAGQIDLIDVAGEQHAFRRDELEMQLSHD